MKCMVVGCGLGRLSSLFRYVAPLISLCVPLSLLAGTLLFFGCAGTTHHFLPPRPLDKNEIMLSWTWHYDFDQWNMPSPCPSVNVYYGLNNQDNIGAGLQLLGLTHVSYARYMDEDHSARGFLYLHLNQPIGTLYNNPYFEIGGGGTSYRGGTHYMVSGGLGFGHGMSYGLMGILPSEISQRKDARDFTHVWRLIPTVKCAALGQDVGASLSYYHGKAELIRDNVANAVTNCQDTIVFVPAEMIDSVGYAAGDYEWGGGPPAVFLKNDSIICLYADGYSEYDPDLKTTWAPLIWSTYPHISSYYVAGRRYLGSRGKILEKVRSGGDLIITKYPDSLLTELYRPTSLLRDISIGVGATHFQGGQ